MDMNGARGHGGAKSASGERSSMPALAAAPSTTDISRNGGELVAAIQRTIPGGGAVVPALGSKSTDKSPRFDDRASHGDQSGGGDDDDQDGGDEDEQSTALSGRKVLIWRRESEYGRRRMDHPPTSLVGPLFFFLFFYLNMFISAIKTALMMFSSAPTLLVIHTFNFTFKKIGESTAQTKEQRKNIYHLCLLLR
jgi:hypothetical protein